jgi:hypothetical protein
VVEAIIARVIAQQIQPDLKISGWNRFHRQESSAASINKIIYLCEQAAAPDRLECDWNSHVLWVIGDWQLVVNGMANIPNH